MQVKVSEYLAWRLVLAFLLSAGCARQPEPPTKRLDPNLVPFGMLEPTTIRSLTAQVDGEAWHLTIELLSSQPMQKWRELFRSSGLSEVNGAFHARGHEGQRIEIRFITNSDNSLIPMKVVMQSSKSLGKSARAVEFNHFTKAPRLLAAFYGGGGNSVMIAVSELPSDELLSSIGYKRARHSSTVRITYDHPSFEVGLVAESSFDADGKGPKRPTPTLLISMPFDYSRYISHGRYDQTIIKRHKQ